jgi:DNA-binding CsgD family transcriptional regulator
VNRLAVAVPEVEVRSEDVLEHLDVGVVAMQRATHEILFANAAAGELLASLGHRLHEVLRSRLLPEIDAVPTRFTPAIRVEAADGRHFYTRAKAMERPAGAILICIVQATVREREVRRILTTQFGLSLQEIKVATLASQGYRNKEIAERLRIVEGTVKNYLTRVFEVLSVRSRAELVAELHQLADEVTDSLHRGA